MLCYFSRKTSFIQLTNYNPEYQSILILLNFYIITKNKIILIFRPQVQKMQPRRLWTPKQDEAIINLVKRLGIKRWVDVSKQLQSKYKIYGRSGKQCRQRWHNHLNPDINKRPWSTKQMQIIFQNQKKYGNQWTLIARLLQGRTDNSIKNFFYSTLRKNLRKVSKISTEDYSYKSLKNIKSDLLSQIFYYSGFSNDSITPQNMEIVQQCKVISEILIDFSYLDLQHRLTNSWQQKLQILIGKLLNLNKHFQDKNRKKHKVELQKKQNDILIQFFPKQKYDIFEQQPVHKAQSFNTIATATLIEEVSLEKNGQTYTKQHIDQKEDNFFNDDLDNLQIPYWNFMENNNNYICSPSISLFGFTPKGPTPHSLLDYTHTRYNGSLKQSNFDECVEDLRKKIQLRADQ